MNFSMKVVGRTILCFLLALTLATPSLAQEKQRAGVMTPVSTIAVVSVTPPPVGYVLPYPGILPDHPLYILKVGRDRLVLFFTRDPLEKIKIKHHLADKRLMMGKTLIEKGKIDLGATTISKGEKYLLDAIADARLVSTHNPQFDRSMFDRLLGATMKHQEVIATLFSQTALNQRSELELSVQLAQEANKEISQVKQEKGK